VARGRIVIRHWTTIDGQSRTNPLTKKPYLYLFFKTQLFASQITKMAQVFSSLITQHNIIQFITAFCRFVQCFIFIAPDTGHLYARKSINHLSKSNQQ